MNLVIQYGIELTYPQSVPVMAALSCYSQQIFGLLVTQVGQTIFTNIEENGTKIANITFCCILGVAAITQMIVKEDLKRQNFDQGEEENLQ